MKKIIFIVMVICFTSAAQAAVNEYYTVTLNAAKNQTNDIPNSSSYLVWNKHYTTNSKDLDGQSQLSIFCSYGSKFITVITASGNAKATSKFDNYNDCMNILAKITSRRKIQDGSESFDITPLKVRFNPTTNDISFEY